MSTDLIALWNEAARIDKTLTVREQNIPDLQRKRVNPIPYSRSLMFSRMARGQISVFKDLPVPVKNDDGRDLWTTLTEGIRTGFPKTRTARIQKGHSRQRVRLRIPEVMRRWNDRRSILSVTDLHFRETKFDDVIDTTTLSDFNILCTDNEYGPEFKQLIEMMTLVISSKGNLTDNHADDCDGTNHCFLGKKLWLAWDRIEGQAAGFEDVDRNPVQHQAAFDLSTFLSMPSARWFTVEPEQTLFLPGSLAHKVVTLEHYIGVGSFHVALPSYMRCLERWILHDTHDIVPSDLLVMINRAVVRRLGALRRASNMVKERWGLSQMKESVEKWHAGRTSPIKEMLLHNPLLTEFVESARRA